MSKVNHQYIIRVHSILQRKQKYFIFMQYGENGDLLEFIRNNGPVRERQARIWFAQVLKGMHQQKRGQLPRRVVFRPFKI